MQNSTGPKSDPAGHRDNNFDFLRFALATLVIFSHSFDMIGGRESNPVLRATGGQVELGTLAVDGFFILSGFLIAQSFTRSRSVADYFRRRALRIYPGFVAASVLSLILFAPLGMRFARDYWSYVEPWPFAVRVVALKTLWVPHTFTTNHWPYVNAPLWTIQYEFICYILVAVLGLAGLLRRRRAVLALFAIVYAFNAVQMPLKLWLYDWQEFPVGGAPDYYPRFITYFLAGTLAFLYRDRLAFRPGVAVALLAPTFVLAWYGHGVELLLPFSLTYALFAAAFWRRLPFHGWAKHGDFSYGLYLYGWPVQQCLIFYCRSWISPLPLFALALPLTFLLAVASWYGIERPFLRFKQRSGTPAMPAREPPPSESVATAIAGEVAPA